MKVLSKQEFDVLSRDGTYSQAGWHGIPTVTFFVPCQRNAVLSLYDSNIQMSQNWQAVSDAIRNGMQSAIFENHGVPSNKYHDLEAWCIILEICGTMNTSYADHCVVFKHDPAYRNEWLFRSKKWFG